MWKDENAFVWRCWLQLHLHVKHDVKRGSAWSLSIPSAHQQPVLPRLFLCSICAPTCQPNVTDQISPCHSLFAQGKRGCAPVMCQYGFRWPKTMRCRHFPKANGNRLRVNRNAMVRNSASIITLQQKIFKRTNLAGKLWRMVFHLAITSSFGGWVTVKSHLPMLLCAVISIIALVSFWNIFDWHLWESS